MLVEEVVLDVPYLQSEVIHVLDLVQREQIELLGFAAVAVPTDPRKRITVRFVADRPRLCMQTLRSQDRKSVV